MQLNEKENNNTIMIPKFWTDISLRTEQDVYVSAFYSTYYMYFFCMVKAQYSNLYTANFEIFVQKFRIFTVIMICRHLIHSDMSRVVRKPAFCICENKEADQLCGSREADQRLCFRYTDSTIPLLSKSEISSP